jgi:hypothetical protein
MSGELLVCFPDGELMGVANDYESIKLAMQGATIDLVMLPDDGHGFFVDDNGMLEAATFNVPASIFAQMALYGPVVLCGPADPEGNTKPPHKRVANGFMALATMWRSVVIDATRKGQNPLVAADPDTVPPARVIGLSEEQFEAYLLRGELPDE